MFWSILTFEAIVLLVASRRLHRWQSAERREALVARTAAAVGLPTPSAYEAHVPKRLVRRERSAIAGQALVVMAAIPPFFLVGSISASSQPLSLFILLAIGVLSRPLALSALMAWEVFARRHGAGPRVARLVTPVLADYVSPYTVWTARLMAVAVVPGATLITWFAQDVRIGHATLARPGVAVVIASSLAGLTVVELIAQRLVALPQPAATPTQLAWDDALRAQQLDQLYTAVTLLSLVATVFVVAVLVGGGSALWVLLAALVLFNLGGEPASRYRRRLWPTLGDQVRS